ncbi:hypothetical protein LAZ67_23001758 [Cordylochernes scorpioides]|uniref:Titin n=1 Tax=Cordylochernes scorpioides TaxID=51811 RepID=A0ABY6LVP9_9ARAC|nr:hypothetical protein LAZ67_23001758 [Cordylochernes scorpioides]
MLEKARINNNKKKKPTRDASHLMILFFLLVNKFAVNHLIGMCRDDEPMKPGKNTKISQDKETVSLEILDSSPYRDTGTYRCVATNPQGSVDHTARVTVQRTGARFVEPLRDVEVKEREAALFTVRVSHEDAEVTWHKDGELIEPSDKFRILRDGPYRKLIVEDAQVRDEAEYTCVLGELETTADLVVVELPPEITSQMTDVKVAKDETATFQVELTKGDALVRWFKDVPTVEFRVRLPEKTTAPQDTDVTFTVELSRPDADVTWLKAGKPVSERDRRFETSEVGTSRTLTIRSVRREDSAEFTCVSGNVRTSTKLKVEEVSAEFTLKLRDVTVRESDTATLLVEVTREVLEVRWYRDDTEIVPTARLIVEKEGKRRRLIIRDTTLDDAATYTCALDEKKCTAKLIIEAPPRVTTEDRKLRVLRGASVIIEAPFVAFPPPRVEWAFEGQPLEPSRRIAVEPDRTALTIRNAENSDVGLYSLKLTNRCGETNVDFTLTIIDKPKAPGCPEASEIIDDAMTLSWKAPSSDGGAPILTYLIEFHDRSTLRWTLYNENFSVTECHHRVGEPPVVVEQLQDMTAGLKAYVKMECRITGQPVPTTKWLKNGKDMLATRTVTTAYEQQVASLTITETTEKSAGTYTCRATNPLGEAQTSATLKIQEPPKAEFDPKLKHVRLPASQEYAVTVRTSGYPTPEVRWLKNGQPLLSTRHTLISMRDNETAVTIRAVVPDDSAIYTVWLTNEAGSASHDFRLKVLDKPLPPEGPLTFPKIDKETITISWNPPEDDGGSEVTHYVVEKCDVRRKVWMEVTVVRSDVTTYTVQDLTEGTDYQFRVSAINEYGRGEPLVSDTVTAKSQFEKPSAPTGPFTATNVTESSLTLHWGPPESDGGSPVLEYVVERREVGKRAWTRVGATDGHTTAMDVLGLRTAEQEYEFRVCARNAVGLGPPFTAPAPITLGTQICKFPLWYTILSPTYCLHQPLCRIQISLVEIKTTKSNTSRGEALSMRVL